MKILFLGERESKIIPFLTSQGEEVVVTDQKIDPSDAQGYDFLLSYRYRHILRKNVLDLFPQKAVNIHNGLLPWNRGADANLWSHVEETPKGVTIHYIDEGIDTGDILVSKEVTFTEQDTLATSWATLWEVAQDLFIDNWKGIKNGELKGCRQTGEGTFHLAKDKETVHLPLGWDTPLSEVPTISRGQVVNESS